MNTLNIVRSFHYGRCYSKSYTPPESSTAILDLEKWEIEYNGQTYRMGELGYTKSDSICTIELRGDHSGDGCIRLYTDAFKSNDSIHRIKLSPTMPPCRPGMMTMTIPSRYAGLEWKDFPRAPRPKSN